MANNWKNIWNNKLIVANNKPGDEFIRFCELKKANGFDVAVDNAEKYYRGFYDGWICFYDKVMNLCGGSVNSVFEVGCGSGVNLYMFKNRLPQKSVFGGVDYSRPMVESAKISTECEDFSCCGANEISIHPQYDVVMSESVFQYFDSLEYAETVLRKMICKAGKLVYLGEIHEKKYEQELLAYRRKTIENYDEKYAGLKKLFFEKDWIERIASDYGKKVEYTYINNPEYINGKYEFNCYIF